MKKDIIISTLLILVSCCNIYGQNKYFEKSLRFADGQQAERIKPVNSNFILAGNHTYISDNLAQIYTMIVTINGDTIGLNVYEYPNSEVFFNDMIKTSSGHILTGCVRDTTHVSPCEATLLFINPNGELLNWEILGDSLYYSEMRAIAPTPDKGYLLGGQSAPYTMSPFWWELYLVKVDSLGNKQWEKTYTEYAYNNTIRDIFPAEDGGYYLTASVNLLPSENLGDALLLKINEQGDIIDEYLYDFGDEEQTATFIHTLDGGFLISFKFNDNDKGLLKLNANFEVEWTQEDIFQGCGAGGLLQLPDSSYVAAGCYRKFDILTGTDIQMNIAKLTKDGEVLWNRLYGGDFNDYGYDLISTLDGSFMITGRAESIMGPNIYLVKTNCLGLLTEPIADFTPLYANLNAVFINNSQYVYPDSIDGGHYHWDFGDGTTSTEQAPAYVYETYGTYTVTLTVSVCNDVSVMTKVIELVPPVGVEKVRTDIHFFPPYPNPAKEAVYFNYHLPEEKVAELQILDINGRKMETYTLKSNDTFRLDVNNWETGIYFYHISINGNIVQRDKIAIF